MVSNKSDNELVRAFQQGHGKAFEALFEKYYKKLVEFCVKRVNNRQDAEQLTQDIFNIVICRINTYRDFRKENGFRAWLFRISSTTISNHWRHEMKRQSVVQTAFDIKNIQRPRFDKPEQALQKKEFWEMAFRGMRIIEIECVIAHHINGTSLNDMMITFMLSYSQVNYYLAKGRQTLRANLRRYYVER